MERLFDLRVAQHRHFCGALTLVHCVQIVYESRMTAQFRNSVTEFCENSLQTGDADNVRQVFTFSRLTVEASHVRNFCGATAQGATEFRRGMNDDRSRRFAQMYVLMRIDV